MGNLHGRMATKGNSEAQIDKREGRLRVATYVDGNTVSYENEDFTVADTASVLDFFADLGRFAHEGYFTNDGPGDIKIELSFDGSVYGGMHTLRGGDSVSFQNLSISRARLTHVDDCGFRCLAG
jgi:hypothetical protein